MRNITFNHLKYLFSESRILPYFQEKDTPAEVLRKYHSNIIVSEAMIPTLHYLEICLRNRLARNLDDFRKIVQTLNVQETKVYFLKENLLFTPFNFGGGLGL